MSFIPTLRAGFFIATKRSLGPGNSFPDYTCSFANTTTSSRTAKNKAPQALARTSL